MIAHLSGTLLIKQATSVILDVQGVGYEVIIPVSTFFDIGDTGASVALRIYTHVREDTLQLYGFRYCSRLPLAVAVAPKSKKGSPVKSSSQRF
jgi:Holliday junction resolvasome RuvABC DNA-binding subunit